MTTPTQQPMNYWCGTGYHRNCKGVLFPKDLPCSCECHERSRRGTEPNRADDSGRADPDSARPGAEREPGACVGAVVDAQTPMSHPLTTPLADNIRELGDWSPSMEAMRWLLRDIALSAREP